ncbi:hypothetical protein EV356DRAFT_503287 [Viridothelium virens]|uniref:Uncharacterized protein n=1 Tax=Viridothelium virens TaxID=1048519 RepID=A0A6A6H7E5_VIRVR|nr:hypothetical protein EV356DRAFT_503287 [Viridothelium virens]
MTTGIITGSSPSVPITLDRNSISCDSAFDMLRSCASETPDFTKGDDGYQASCLCYSHSTFDPWSFDNLQSACVSYATTADQTDLSVCTAAAGLCTLAGNVRSATAIVNSPGQATPAPTSSIPVSTSMLQPPSTQLPSKTAATSVAPREQVRVSRIRRCHKLISSIGLSRLGLFNTGLRS